MYENELLQDIINGINDNYDMSGSISQWIDEDIFQFFDELLSNGIKLDESEKRQLLSKLANINPTFFTDKSNIIYLKLVNLYGKISQISGENQELYYITDRFLPNSKNATDIIKQMHDIIREKDFRSFVVKQFNYDSILLPYKNARENAEFALKNTTDDDTLTEAIEALDSSLNTYSNKEYVTDMIVDNRQEDYHDVIEKMGIDSLARIYCEINGGTFTAEEKMILKNELSQEQQDVLYDVASGKKR